MISEPDRYIMLARYKGYKTDFRGALDTLNEGLERHPDYGPLYRHRAHRWITFREFDKSIADSERAIELCENEPDEIEYYHRELVADVDRLVLDHVDEILPQRLPVTLETIAELERLYKSTLHSSIWYHYGLAFYLKGDYERSAREYLVALGKGIDDDMRAATSDWIYMSYRRAGHDGAAQEFLDSVSSDLQVNEDAYFRRLLMYKGEIAPDTLLADATRDATSLVTQGYGLGNWYLCNGEPDKAIAVFEKIVAAGVTNAFGHIAAEIDLARLKGAN